MLKILKIFLIIVLLFIGGNSFGVIEKYPLKKGNINNKQKDEFIKGYFTINKTNFDIEDNIKITIILKSKNKELKGNIEFLGVQNFTLISQQKSKSKFSSDSKGNLYETIIINLEYKAKQSGKYEIGPLTFNKKILAFPKKIEISGEKLFVGKMPIKSQEILENTDKIFEDLKKNSKEKIKFNQKINSQKSEHKNSNTINKKTIDISDMNDIYETKQNAYPPLFDKITLIIFGFLIFFYLIFSYFSKKIKLQPTPQKIQKKPEKKEKIDFLKLLNDLEKNEKKLKTQEFYAKINNIFRLFLDKKFDKNLSSKSLNELKNILEKKYFDTYKKIYFPEYAYPKNNSENRKKIIEEIKNLIK